MIKYTTWNPGSKGSASPIDTIENSSFKVDNHASTPSYISLSIISTATGAAAALRF